VWGIRLAKESTQSKSLEREKRKGGSEGKKVVEGKRERREET
jgi:hypothetical protein